MLTTRTKLKRTIELVEARLADATSEHPTRDLMFLAEQYQSRNEWDKASAASREMMRVAEGGTPSKFEVTPLDVEVLLEAQRHRKALSKQIIRVVMIAIAIEVAVFAGLQLLTPGKLAEPFTDLRIACLPFDTFALIDKARFEWRRREWKQATAHLDQVLALSPRNHEAYLMKSYIALAQNDFDSALKFANHADQKDFKVINLKAQILFRQGEYLKSALLPLEAINAGIGHPDPYTAGQSAKAFCFDGDYDAAYAAAQKQEAWATDQWMRSEAQATQANALLKLGRLDESISKATLAVSNRDRPWRRTDARAYLYRAESKLKLKDFDGAMEDIKLSMAADTFALRQFEVRAGVFSQLEQWEEANEVLRQAKDFSRAEEM